MTTARAVVPGRFLFITRRCTQRQYLLRPDAETNNAFMYCLGEAAQRFGVVPVLAQMMSNHYHAIVYDPHGREVEFREHFHKMLAKSQNALRKRWENLWAAEEPCVVELIERDDLLEKMVYTATNPVKDGLVDAVHHWPGPPLVAALLSGEPLRAPRPKHFFREDGSMPKEVVLALKLPEHFEGKQEFLTELRTRIADVQKCFARERQKEGRRVLGRRRVLDQSWRGSPTSFEPRRNLRPRVAARRKETRIETLERNKEWLASYRDSRKQWLAGLHVEFPYGTYWLQRFAKVPVKPPPEHEAN